MATVSAEDRDPHFGNEPLRGTPQITGKRDDESPPRSRSRRRRRAPKTPANRPSQIGQPPHESTPIYDEQPALSLHAISIHVTVEKVRDDGVADHPIRLCEIRQHTDTQSTRPATKPPDREQQILRAQTGHVALVVSERDEHPNLPAVGAKFGAHHAFLHFPAEILLGRTLHPDDDLHSGHSSCRNHAHGP